MDEKEYLRTPATLVTSTRIEIAGQTFAVRNVGSVKVTKPGRPYIAAFLLVVCVAAAAMQQTAGWAIAAIVPGAWIWQQLRMRRLILVTGGGETVALKSTNGTAVETLRAAIAQAISAR